MMKRIFVSVALIFSVILVSCSNSIESNKNEENNTTSITTQQPTLIPTLFTAPTEEHLPTSCMAQFTKWHEMGATATDAGISLIRAADLNGDGWDDVIITRIIFQTTEIREIDILLNNQHGKLIQATKEIFTNEIPKVQHPWEIIFDDFNGDGRLDFFIADNGMDTGSFPGYQNTLVLSQPEGKLMNATQNLPQQFDQTHSAAAADIDADGDVDIYIGNLGGGGILPQIWLNNGEGVFSVGNGILPQAQLNGNLNWYTTAEFADINNDKSPDLILGQSNPNRNSHVLVNNGTGNVHQLETELPQTPLGSNDSAIDIKSSDINHDGYSDLLIVHTRITDLGRHIQVLINNQDGTFSDETEVRLPQVYYDGWLRYVDLIDLNLDDKLDIVATQMIEPGPVFYINNGMGEFSEWDSGADLYNFAFLDFDNDGDLDILNAGDADPESGGLEWYELIENTGCTKTAKP